MGLGISMALLIVRGDLRVNELMWGANGSIAFLAILSRVRVKFKASNYIPPITRFSQSYRRPTQRDLCS